MSGIVENVVRVLGERVRTRDADSVRDIIRQNLPRSLAPLSEAAGAGFGALVRTAPVADPAAHIALQISDTVAFLDAALPGVREDDPWIGFVADGVDSDFEVRLSAVPALLRLVAEIPGRQYVIALDGRWCCYWNFGDSLRFGYAKRLGA